MTSYATLTDEDLTAFLDGEVSEARSREIEARVNADPYLQQRLEALALDTELIHDAFDDLLLQAPGAPALLGSSAVTAPPTRRIWPSLVAASLAGALFAGGLGAFFADGGPQNDWRGYVASYQALYVGKTLSHLDRSDGAKAAELAIVADTIGKDIALDALTAEGSLDYKRAQILGFKGRPLIQLAFLSKMGEPLALCIIRGEAGADEAMTSAAMEGLSAASWARDGFAYILIGGTDQAAVDSAAKHFAAVL